MSSQRVCTCHMPPGFHALSCAWNPFYEQFKAAAAAPKSEAAAAASALVETVAASAAAAPAPRPRPSLKHTPSGRFFASNPLAGAGSAATPGSAPAAAAIPESAADAGGDGEEDVVDGKVVRSLKASFGAWAKTVLTGDAPAIRGRRSSLIGSSSDGGAGAGAGAGAAGGAAAAPSFGGSRVVGGEIFVSEAELKSQPRDAAIEAEVLADGAAVERGQAMREKVMALPQVQAVAAASAATDGKELPAVVAAAAAAPAAAAAGGKGKGKGGGKGK